MPKDKKLKFNQNINVLNTWKKVIEFNEIETNPAKFLEDVANFFIAFNECAEATIQGGDDIGTCLNQLTDFEYFDNDSGDGEHGERKNPVQITSTQAHNLKKLAEGLEFYLNQPAADHNFLSTTHPDGSFFHNLRAIGGSILLFLNQIQSVCVPLTTILTKLNPFIVSTH